jgi:hypothetical protein
VDVALKYKFERARRDIHRSGSAEAKGDKTANLQKMLEKPEAK